MKEENKSKTGLIILFVIIGIVIAALIGCIIYFATRSSSNEDNDNHNNSSKTNIIDDTSDSGNKQNYKKNPKLNEVFVFDDLEITLGSDISFTKLKNRYSENNGKDVVKMPITVKNIKNETHGLNMFYYNIYGSQGTEVDNVASYFDEDSIEYAGDLRPGSSYTKYLYFIYDGDGNYAIEFNNFSSKKTVEFNIKK